MSTVGILEARVADTTAAVVNAAAQCRNLRAALHTAENEFDIAMDDALSARSALAAFVKRTG